MLTLQYLDGVQLRDLDLETTSFEERRELGYYLQDTIGKTGIEFQYEQYLRGTYGWREVERDAIVDEIEAFSKTVKVKRRFSLRKLIEEGRR